MSRKASPTAIGAFVLTGAALAVLVIGYFGSGRFLSERTTYVMFFEGQLNGLSVGAPVLFRGVRVGTVTDIIVRYNTQDREITIPVYVEMERNRVERVGTTRSDPVTAMKMLIDRGLRARLTMQSFVTGMLAIQLDFVPGAELRYVGLEPGHPEIPTVPSPLEELQKTLQTLPIEEIARDLQRAVKGVDELVRSEDLRTAVRSFDSTIKDFGALARNVNGRIEPLADEILATSAQARSTFKSIEERVATVESELNAALREFRRLAENVNGRVESLVNEINRTAELAQAALVQARSMLATTEGVLSPESDVYQKTVIALEEFASAARSLRLLADAIERNPEALIQGKRSPGG